MNIGYARVSTQDQNLDLQNDALKAAGCENIYTDKMSGAKKNRPGLEEILGFIRKGDTLVVWRLDRLGRSLKHLIQVLNQLDERGVYFKSLQESLDTSTPGGMLIFHVFGALAEFERDIIKERTLAGLAAARARGRKGDTLVVWKLDRLGRSLKHLIQVLNTLDERGVYFKSVQESLDTSTPGGKLIFHVFGALAEFERDIIKERTLAGIAAARARGRKGGRPRKLTKKQIAMAKKLMGDQSIPIDEICKTMGVSKATLYRCAHNLDLAT